MEWIIVESDSLPSNTDEVLVFCYGAIFIANCSEWNKGTDRVFRVWLIDGTVASETPTHWMPLPSPPEAT